VDLTFEPAAQGSAEPTLCEKSLPYLLLLEKAVNRRGGGFNKIGFIQESQLLVIKIIYFE
jgi:hypothetical protein